MRILFRNSAARCTGNIKGPKVSSRCVRLQAGWYADKICPGSSRAVPSDAERFLPWPLGLEGVVHVGLSLMLDGESSNESLSLLGEESRDLYSSQKFSSIFVFVPSTMSSLTQSKSVTRHNHIIIPSTLPFPSISPHASNSVPISHSSEEP
jgi:hypothetical protein